MILSRRSSSPGVLAAPDWASALARPSQPRQSVIRLVTSPSSSRVASRCCCRSSVDPQPTQNENLTHAPRNLERLWTPPRLHSNAIRAIRELLVAGVFKIISQRAPIGRKTLVNRRLRGKPRQQKFAPVAPKADSAHLRAPMNQAKCEI